MQEISRQKWGTELNKKEELKTPLSCSNTFPSKG